jgi:hypothetical protein
MTELSARGLSYRAIAKAFKTTHGMVRRVIQGEGGYAPETNNGKAETSTDAP